MQTSYVFVTGGVLSGLGKGITTASIGKVLQSKGFKVTAVKIDPYLNCDAGTMRPTEHGEVWVTNDGGEIDQDLGNYERFLNVDIPKNHNITTGQIYGEVIKKERKGGFLGKTVEVIPHITDEVKRRIKKVARDTKADFVIVEIGGTVGEYQNEIYYRTGKLMQNDGEKVLFIHVTYLPVPKHVGEMKTKPTQQSVEMLGKLGIQPDFVVCRSEHGLDMVRKKKISVFCNVKEDHIISNPDVESVYELPLIFEEQKFSRKILKKLDMKAKKSDLKEWRKFVRDLKNVKNVVRIGIVGKYFDIGDYKLPDTYVSVIEAIKHAAWANKRKPVIEWIDSKQFEHDKKKLAVLKNVDGIIVPGGFGTSGIEGKILAIEYARKKKIPYLGLCLGMQLAVIEYARNVCGLKGANSTEFNPKTKYPVIDILPEQKELMKKSDYGASMRLGDYPAVLKKGTVVRKLYGTDRIVERHRHRFEVNPEFHVILEKNGLVFSGMSPDRRLAEFIELKGGSFFAATQSHPEFTSRPLKPNPLFNGFMKAAVKS